MDYTSARNKGSPRHVQLTPALRREGRLDEDAFSIKDNRFKVDMSSTEEAAPSASSKAQRCRLDRGISQNKRLVKGLMSHQPHGKENSSSRGGQSEF